MAEEHTYAVGKIIGDPNAITLHVGEAFIVLDYDEAARLAADLASRVPHGHTTQRKQEGTEQ